ncbi:MAG: alpha/beta hydrolase [Actinobacteria bacterium]|nr:alpha/beta hydrolase [Actinomycetota bacterium]
MMRIKFLKLTCILLCTLVFLLLASSCSPKETATALTSEKSQQTEPVEESAATETTAQTTSEKQTTKETTAQESTSLEVREVSFITEDDIKIAGRIFGKSETGIILSHMYPADQTSWDSFANMLMQNGYEAMTFDFRGYGKSEGKKEIDKIYKDLTAALNFIKEDGAKSVVLIGASMGGTASLFVASQNRVDGVITISAPVEFKGLKTGDLKKISCPKLFIAGEKDSSAAQSAKYLYENSTDPREMAIYPTDEHGTYIFDGPYGEDLSNQIFDFLTTNAAGK